jgi:hypothetical protein
MQTATQYNLTKRIPTLETDRGNEIEWKKEERLLRMKKDAKDLCRQNIQNLHGQRLDLDAMHRWNVAPLFNFSRRNRLIS